MAAYAAYAGLPAAVVLQSMQEGSLRCSGRGSLTATGHHVRRF
jgi:hypothetical protein